MQKILLLSLLFSGFIAKAQWSSNTTVNTSICSFSNTTSKTSSVSCSDGNGGAFIAWIDSRNTATTGGDVYIQKINADGTLAFNVNGLVVCDATGSQSNISIAADGNGGAFLVWQDPRSNPTPANLTYAQRVSANGTMLWTANGVTTTQVLTGSQTVPTAVVTSLGEFFVVTRDARTTATTGTDIYAQKLNSTTGAPLLANDLPIVTVAGTQNLQQVATDTSGNFIVTWADQRSPGSSSNAQIYAQKILANGTIAWTTDGVVVCSNLPSSNRLDPQVAFARSVNDYIISWTDTRVASTDANIYAQRISNIDGSGIWTTNGVAVCTATGSQSSSFVKITSDDAALITWIDPRTSGTTGNDIYTHKIKLSDGTAFSANWVADGTVVCNATQSQTSAACVPNNIGGAYFVWSDPRTGTGLTPNDIYSLSLNGDASISSGWVANGNFVCNAAGTQTSPTIIASTQNSFICTWQDARGGTSNGELYASKVYSNGVLPLTFVSVNAFISNNQSTINWKTANELNTKSFVVERSTNGLNFSSITSINAAGSGNNSYTVNDAAPIAGENYYRIKGVDADGKTQYSNIVKVVLNKKGALTVLVTPNPVKNAAQLNISNIENGKYSIKIVDIVGKIYQTQIVYTNNNLISQSIQLNNLNQGTYIIQLVSEQGTVLNNTRIQKL